MIIAYLTLIGGLIGLLGIWYLRTHQVETVIQYYTLHDVENLLDVLEDAGLFKVEDEDRYHLEQKIFTMMKADATTIQEDKYLEGCRDPRYYFEKIVIQTLTYGE